MNVSLCGPHSLETSTLPPMLAECELERGRIPSPFWMCWYLFHQVGAFGSGTARAAPDISVISETRTMKVTLRMFDPPSRTLISHIRADPSTRLQRARDRRQLDLPDASAP